MGFAKGEETKKYFNVTGICIPGQHYMVDISNKGSQIAAMVEKGNYFTIIFVKI